MLKKNNGSGKNISGKTSSKTSDRLDGNKSNDTLSRTSNITSNKGFLNRRGTLDKNTSNKGEFNGAPKKITLNRGELNEGKLGENKSYRKTSNKNQSARGTFNKSTFSEDAPKESMSCKSNFNRIKSTKNSSAYKDKSTKNIFSAEGRKKTLNAKISTHESSAIKTSTPKKTTAKKSTKTSNGVILGGNLNSKQRANLRAVASIIEPIYQIGKDGVSESQLSGIAQALNKRELIKITVLKNSGLTAKDLLADLAQKLDALAVSAIGNKVILYRRSDSDEIKHLEF